MMMWFDGGTVKRRHATLWLGLALSLSLGACGIGQHQNPVASDGELGTTQPVKMDQDQVSTYTTRRGDTLAGIAGRSEIYGDPSLWPLLQNANPESLASKGRAQALKAGLVLQVPRDSDAQTLARARAKDRRAQAAAKARARRERARGLPPGAPTAATPRRAPTAVTQAAASRLVPSPMPVAPPASPPSGGMRPLLLLLVLVLLALGAVLWAFAKRDRDDGA